MSSTLILGDLSDAQRANESVEETQFQITPRVAGLIRPPPLKRHFEKVFQTNVRIISNIIEAAISQTVSQLINVSKGTVAYKVSILGNSKWLQWNFPQESQPSATAHLSPADLKISSARVVPQLKFSDFKLKWVA